MLEITKLPKSFEDDVYQSSSGFNESIEIFTIYFVCGEIKLAILEFVTLRHQDETETI